MIEGECQGAFQAFAVTGAGSGKSADCDGHQCLISFLSFWAASFPGECPDRHLRYAAKWRCFECLRQHSIRRQPGECQISDLRLPASQWVSSGVAGAPVCSQVGAGNISYNAGTTGAVTTTVGAKLQRIVDLDDYKSAATGADYCAALQAAITANPGATIRFPATVVQLGTASSTCNIT